MPKTTRPVEAQHRRWVLLCCLVVVPVALKMGFDFGYQLAGVLLGLAAALNMAVISALLIDFAVDRLLSRKTGVGAESPTPQG